MFNVFRFRNSEKLNGEHNESVAYVPDVVVSVKGRKLKLMYQHREKSCILNSVMTSFAKRHKQLIKIIAVVAHFDH